MTHHHTNALTSHGTVYQTPVQSTLQAPEIDPGTGLTAALLLAGLLAVIVGKRRT